MTLAPGQWLAMISSSPRLNQERVASFVRVLAVRPLSGPGGNLKLDVYHASHPDGLRKKRYLLHILHSFPKALAAEEVCEDADTPGLLLFPLTRDWLHRNFPEAPVDAPSDADLMVFLDREHGFSGENRVKTPE